MQQFLKALWPQFEVLGGYRIALFTKPSSKGTKTDNSQTEWFELTDEGMKALSERAEEHRQDSRDVYISMAAFDSNAQGRSNENARLIPGLWLDLDCYSSSTSKNKGLSSEEAMKFIETMEPKPSMVVDSGGGYHVYWLFESSIDAQKHQELPGAWVAHCSRRVGKELDHVGDLARVLRLPGALNFKSQPPKPVTLQFCDTSRRYGPQDFARCLAPSDAPRPSRPATATPARQATKALKQEQSPQRRLSEEEIENILEKARRAENGPKFIRLFDEGDTSGYKSDSEADLALCSLLIHFFGKDPVVIGQMFRKSALMRPKWNESHGGSTYGEKTLSEAISGYQNYGYDPSVDTGLDDFVFSGWFGIVKASACMVYQAIAALEHEKEITPGNTLITSYREISAKAAVSQKTISGSLTVLENFGLVTCATGTPHPVRRHGTSITRTLPVPLPPNHGKGKA